MKTLESVQGGLLSTLGVIRLRVVGLRHKPLAIRDAVHIGKNKTQMHVKSRTYTLPSPGLDVTRGMLRWQMVQYLPRLKESLILGLWRET